MTAAYQLAVQTGFREVADALVERRRYAEQIVALYDTVGVPHGHWNTITFVAGLTPTGMIAPWVLTSQ